MRLPVLLFWFLGATGVGAAQTPRIVLTPRSVTLSAPVGSGLSSTQTVAVTTSGPGGLSGLTRTISYAAGQRTGWLRAVLSGSTTPATLTLQGRASTALLPGTYDATVTVRSRFLSQSVVVSFRVVSLPPAIGVAATANLSAPAGSLTPAMLLLDVTNTGGGALGGLQASVSYPAGETPGWLTAVLGRPDAPTMAPTRLRLRAAAAQNLLPGVHHATVRITSAQASNSPQLVDVAFDITGSNPLMALSPSSVSFIANIGAGDPAPQSVAVTNAGGGTVERLTRAITYGPGQPTGWLRAAFGAKAAPTTLELRAVNVAALAPGVYNASVEVNSTTALNAPQTVAVTLTVRGNSPAHLAIVPSTIDFGILGVGVKSASQTVTLTNTGSTPTGIISVASSGPNPGDFSLLPPDPSCQVTAGVLPAGGSCTFTFTFTPSAAGARSMTHVFSATPGGSATLTLGGTGAVATLALTPGAVDFGSVGLGITSPVAVLTLTNVGLASSGPITTGGLLGTNPGDFVGDAAMTTCTSAALAPGASCMIGLAFRPQALGARSATFNLGATPGGLVATTLSGTGSASQLLTISPTSHDFGTVDVGTTSAAQRFTLTNTGALATGRLVPQGPGGANPGDFGFTLVACAANSGGGLDPGATCTFDVTFTPTADGTRSAFVTFAATPGGSATVQLVGTGIFRIVTLTVSPTTRDFGIVPVSQSSSGQTFTVTNPGPSVGISNQGVTSQDFSTDPNGSCSLLFTLAAGASCTINVYFNPQATGPRTGTVFLTTTAGETASATITGTGGPATALAISPALYMFGPVLLGQTSPPATFTITNTTSTRTGPINSFALTGTGTGEYAISQGTCTGAALDPDATCSFSVRFAPTVAGGHPVTLTVSTASGESGATLLRGFGQAPAVLTVTPSPYDFGFVVPGQTAGPVTFTVTNTGAGVSGIINWLGIAFSGPDSADFNLLGTEWTCFATIQLAPGASCTVDVIFIPHASGPRTATLTIVANGVGGGTGTATLTGGAAPGGVLTIAPMAHDFGSLPVGLVSLLEIFTVKNTGTTPALITSVDLQGPAASSYVLATGFVPGPGVWLDVGAELQVTAAFQPQSLGPLPATVRLTYDAGAVSASLTGVGTALTISSSSAEQELLGVPTLADSERVQLDLLGNRDGVYDLGDLLAFLDRNHLKASAAMLSGPSRKENLP